jgi:ADP-ribosylglycohydrolase
MSTAQRLAAMRRSLEGLALGDSLGCALRVAPTNDPSFDDPPWAYTDDTEMAIAIAQMLASRGHIMQDDLALRFAARFTANQDRGYGGVAFWILSRISAGHDWRSVAAEPYGGSGSLGNGAAMRVGPLGAYFADDLPRVVSEAALSAAITHAHPEGQAGAVAVALAASTAATRPSADRTALLDIADRLVPGQVRDLLVRAANLPDASPSEAGAILGTGLRLSAHDTVPYALWCAFGHLHDYRAAQLTAMAGFESAASDRDTICAIVGGIVAMSCADSTIPADWIAQREPLPEDVSQGR